MAGAYDVAAWENGCAQDSARWSWPLQVEAQSSEVDPYYWFAPGASKQGFAGLDVGASQEGMEAAGSSVAGRDRFSIDVLVIGSDQLTQADHSS